MIKRIFRDQRYFCAKRVVVKSIYSFVSKHALASTTLLFYSNIIFDRVQLVRLHLSSLFGFLEQYIHIYTAIRIHSSIIILLQLINAIIVGPGRTPKHTFSI